MAKIMHSRLWIDFMSVYTFTLFILFRKISCLVSHMSSVLSSLETIKNRSLNISGQKQTAHVALDHPMGVFVTTVTLVKAIWQTLLITTQIVEEKRCEPATLVFTPKETHLQGISRGPFQTHSFLSHRRIVYI